VGEEICAEVRRLGVGLPFPEQVWFGEPHPAVREQYFHQARLMDLDALTSPRASEKLSTRLWRRYGAAAVPMLDAIRSDPRMAEVIIETSEYLRCELDEAARREMIVKLEDFLRRRSKIALVVRHEDIRRAAGLREAARILFGDQADARIAEYFGEQDASASLG
jgi:glycerol-3-phosphate dehydrogenase